ncbi:MAG: hypothetical protein ACLFVT_02830 [Syntrophobacteria bacterium]
MPPGRFILPVILGLMLCIGFQGVRFAHSYLMPAQQILEFVARKTSKVYNFRLEVVAKRPDPAFSEGVARKEVVYYAARPDFLRKEPRDAAGETTVLAGSGRRLSVINGHLLEEPARHEDIFPVLLFADSAETLDELLEAEHVDTTQVHLGRTGGRIAYVIGGSPGEPEVPQFWCDKDRFWPLRLVGRRVRAGVADTVDIRFRSYREVASAVWLPSLIEFCRQNKPFLRLEVREAHYNERLPKGLFDLDAFSARYPPLPPAPEPLEKSSGGLDEMRRYLEKKYQ